MNIKVEWTGKWPCLCSGEWKLYIDGMDKSELIPENLRQSDMGTFGTYSSWYFDDDYLEQFEDYEDGMECDEWIEHNKYWLNNISTEHNVQEELYYAFQASDWRHGSCGGCI